MTFACVSDSLQSLSDLFFGIQHAMTDKIPKNGYAIDNMSIRIAILSHLL